MGIINIQTGKLLEGDLPKRTLKLVQEWLNVHKEEILKIWNEEVDLSCNELWENGYNK